MTNIDAAHVHLDESTVAAITEQVAEHLAGSIPVAYRVEHAAELADLGRTTVWGAIRAGELRATKIGGRTVVLREDLLDWLHRHREVSR